MWEVNNLHACVRCRENRGSPVSDLYTGTFRFGQTLERLTVALDT